MTTSFNTNNGFGDQTYWNRPMQGRARNPKLLSKYPSLKTKASKVKTPSRSPSPTKSETSSQSIKSTKVSPSRSVPMQQPMMQEPVQMQQPMTQQQLLQQYVQQDDPPSYAETGKF